MAHDFNNILAVIQGHTDILAFTTESEGDHDPDLFAVRESVARAAQLTDQLLAVGQRQLLSRKAIEVNSLVREVEQSTEQGQFRLCTAELWINADRGSIIEALLALICYIQEAPHRPKVRSP